MANPRKDNKTSAASATTPGNGDAWKTMHDDSASAGSSPESTGSAKASAPAGVSGKHAAHADGSKAASQPSKASAAQSSKEGAASAGSANSDKDELKDAVLEAEAAAIVDNAMDEARAEAESSAAQKEAAEWKDKYVRLHAEWDTYRRRQKEQAETQKALAAEKLVSSLIPVLDDLERSIDYAKKNGETGLLSGVEAVLAKFVDTLCKDGVVVIDPKGEPFEALEAQAVGTVEDASKPDETVADVYQKGYKIGNKVLRPAMVTVTTGGPRREKPKEEDASS